MIKEVTEETFKSAIAEGTVLAEFYAPWCTSCKMLAKILEAIDAENPGVNIIKINVAQERVMAIETLPTIVVYKNGEIAAKLTGVQSKAKLKELL